jgi:hypothetical protein
MIIWIIAQLSPGLSPHLSFFALLAWQFIFAIGMYIGVKRYSGEPGQSIAENPLLLWGSWLIVAGSLIYKFARFTSVKLQLGAGWFLSDAILAHMKENLSAIRLLHFLAVALLVAHYVSNTNPFFKRSGAMALIQAGRNSLEVFCMSAILSVSLNILVATYHPNILGKILLDCAAIFVMIWTARELTKFRGSRRSGHLSQTPA